MTNYEISFAAKPGIPERSRYCYEYAYKWVEQNPEWVLMHGYLDSDFLRKKFNQEYNHAWAELYQDDGVHLIYEPLSDQIFYYVQYALTMRPVAEVGYDLTVAKVLLDEHRIYGPWH